MLLRAAAFKTLVGDMPVWGDDAAPLIWGGRAGAPGSFAHITTSVAGPKFSRQDGGHAEPFRQNVAAGPVVSLVERRLSKQLKFASIQADGMLCLRYLAVSGIEISDGELSCT
jgi:hypothetical protein